MFLRGHIHGRLFARPMATAATAVPTVAAAAVAAVLCRGTRGARQFLLLQRQADLEPPRLPLGLPLVRLQVGEPVQVAAARALEEECGIGASLLRWHPVPITASTSAWSSHELSFLIAHCFAWYRPPKEEHFPNPFELNFRWLSYGELRALVQAEELGLNFSREVVVPLRVAEKLADADMLYEPDA
ncbi:unnamed protein product [Durusdinium trenchii]|uniref:Nudix hydrolase domain-containing protein n=1 Tax=Durusdinium trenchii TaxID=1381693 RepID=A0ABP0R4N6_9DINO